MRYSLKKAINFLIRLKCSDISKIEKSQLILQILIEKLRIKHLYFAAKVLCDFLIIRMNHQSVYKLKNLVNGLKNTTRKNPISDMNILRIIGAYIKAKNDQISQPQPYQIGGEWERILAKFYQDFEIELKKKDIDKIRAILSNLGRGEISQGFQLSTEIPNTIFKKLAYLNWFNKSYHNWKKLTALSDEILAYPKEIGNLPGIEINGRLIPLSAFRLSYFAHKIYNLVKSIDYPTIIEIGGGLGGIPYHIFKHSNLKCTYIDFDTPEACVIASYFLISNFPDKKILLYDEFNIENINLSQYDTIIMPNYVMKDLSEKCCDLVFNSHSLGEMNYSTVREYLRQVNRICKKYFLHANDERKILYWAPDNKLKRRVNLNDPNFELPKKDFKRLYRIPEVIYSDGGYIGYDFDKYYFEYLYERIESEKVSQNV